MASGQQIGSNYDPTGNNAQGRVNVVFRRNWARRRKSRGRRCWGCNWWTCRNVGVSLGLALTDLSIRARFSTFTPVFRLYQ